MKERDIKTLIFDIKDKEEKKQLRIIEMKDLKRFHKDKDLLVFKFDFNELRLHPLYLRILFENILNSDIEVLKGLNNKNLISKYDSKRKTIIFNKKMFNELNKIDLNVSLEEQLETIDKFQEVELELEVINLKNKILKEQYRESELYSKDFFNTDLESILFNKYNDFLLNEMNILNVKDL